MQLNVSYEDNRTQVLNEPGIIARQKSCENLCAERCSQERQLQVKSKPCSSLINSLFVSQETVSVGNSARDSQATFLCNQRSSSGQIALSQPSITNNHHSEQSMVNHHHSQQSITNNHHNPSQQSMTNQSHNSATGQTKAVIAPLRQQFQSVQTFCQSIEIGDDSLLRSCTRTPSTNNSFSVYDENIKVKATVGRELNHLPITVLLEVSCTSKQRAQNLQVHLIIDPSCNVQKVCKFVQSVFDCLTHAEDTVSIQVLGSTSTLLPTTCLVDNLRAQEIVLQTVLVMLSYTHLYKNTVCSPPKSEELKDKTIIYFLTEEVAVQTNFLISRELSANEHILLQVNKKRNITSPNPFDKLLEMPEQSFFYSCFGRGRNIVRAVQQIFKNLLLSSIKDFQFQIDLQDQWEPLSTTTPLPIQKLNSVTKFMLLLKPKNCGMTDIDKKSLQDKPNIINFHSLSYLLNKRNGEKQLYQLSDLKVSIDKCSMTPISGLEMNVHFMHYKRALALMLKQNMFQVDTVSKYEQIFAQFQAHAQAANHISALVRKAIQLNLCSSQKLNLYRLLALDQENWYLKTL